MLRKHQFASQGSFKALLFLIAKCPKTLIKTLSSKKSCATFIAKTQQLEPPSALLQQGQTSHYSRGSQGGLLKEGCRCPVLRGILQLPREPARISPQHPTGCKHARSIMSFSWTPYRESPGSFKNSICDSLLLILWPLKVRVDVWFNAVHLYCLYYIYIAEAVFLGQPQHTLAKLCEWQISPFCLSDNVAPSWFCTNEKRERNSTAYFVLACCIKQACFLPHKYEGYLKQNRKENLDNIPLPFPSTKDFFPSPKTRTQFLTDDKIKEELRGGDLKVINLLGSFCYCKNLWTAEGKWMHGCI